MQAICQSQVSTLVGRRGARGADFYELGMIDRRWAFVTRWGSKGLRPWPSETDPYGSNPPSCPISRRRRGKVWRVGLLLMFISGLYRFRLASDPTSEIASRHAEHLISYRDLQSRCSTSDPDQN